MELHKDIFCYLRATSDIGFFYPYASQNGLNPHEPQNDAYLIGYADVGCMSDPHKAHSQTDYVFTIGNTMIFFRFTKQTLVATFLNHAELIALYEATRECVFLRVVSEYIRSTGGLSSINDALTTIQEDNVPASTR